MTYKGGKNSIFVTEKHLISGKFHWFIGRLSVIRRCWIKNKTP